MPAQWKALLEPLGLDDYRRLGKRVGISHETARKIVLGWKTSLRSIQMVADAIGVSVERIHELRGEPSWEAWNPPDVSADLTHEERDAINRLISLMTVGRRIFEERGQSAEQGPTISNGAGASPAEVIEATAETVPGLKRAADPKRARAQRRRG